MVGLSVALLKRVAVGVSGGVDSAVAALLLKRKGYSVHGVFMRNWDELDETGSCTEDAECATAAWVCRTIGIPFTEMNFVQQYWNDVFQYLLKEYSEGRTPNPDILCNRHIKFGSLAEACTERLGTEWLATGHYARVLGDGKGGVRLLQGVDPSKDQSFFLSQVPQTALRRAVFPLGSLLKSHVRELAAEAGLWRVAQKRDSTGICFIGKKNFKAFISQYLLDRPGRLLDVDTGDVVGQHQGQHHWTLGQHCKLDWASVVKYFVASKSRDSQDMMVCGGQQHPCLYHSSLLTGPPHWLGGEPPSKLLQEGKLECQFRFQHLNPLINCTVQLAPADVMSASTTESNNSRDSSSSGTLPGLVITLERPLRVITPGQFAVLYHGSECLGSATINSTGPSLYALNTHSCRDAILALRRRLPTLACSELARIARVETTRLRGEGRVRRYKEHMAAVKRLYAHVTGDAQAIIDGDGRLQAIVAEDERLQALDSDDRLEKIVSGEDRLSAIVAEDVRLQPICADGMRLQAVIEEEKLNSDVRDDEEVHEKIKSDETIVVQANTECGQKIESNDECDCSSQLNSGANRSNSGNARSKSENIETDSDREMLKLGKR